MRSLNRGMTLADFQTIYWWEWAHRELGRFIGLVYAAGFFWFVGRRSVPLRTALTLAGVGVLLAAQGVVGWIMVASGLKPGMTAVAPLKLTLHLELAAFLFAALIALFVRLGGAIREPASRRASVRSVACLSCSSFCRSRSAASSPGSNAGLLYGTWPLMDGQLVPSGLGMIEPCGATCSTT